MRPPEPSRIERVWRRIDRQPDGCWLWTGARLSNGYGRLGNELAHRLVYEMLVEPIPDGLTIDHLCRVRLCVNPMHLEPVTYSVNTSRAMPFRDTQNGRAERTHCPRNHPYDEANTYVSGSGWRRCRTCNRDRVAALRSSTTA